MKSVLASAFALNVGMHIGALIVHADQRGFSDTTETMLDVAMILLFGAAWAWIQTTKEQGNG